MSSRSDRFRSFVATRRHALQLGTAGIGLAAMPRTAAFAQATPDATPVMPGDVPVSGEAVPELAAFDAAMAETMARWNLPGGQLAIARDERLVYNRAFGYASVEDGEAVEPDMTFRIASNTKPITAVAILKLIDAGEIALDTPVFPLLALEGPANAPYDARLDTITVEHLLVHSGGWNSSATGFDPQYPPGSVMASHVFGAESPADPTTIIRYMLGQPLDFDPGTVSAYSNLGFNVLGRVIERLSGQSYEQFTIDEVLAPAGATSMAIGGTTLAERMEGEVRYYSPPGLPTRESVYPGEGFAPVGYGSFSMPGLDAHGGWIASAADTIRFALAVDGQRGTALLTPEAVTLMETAPRPPSAAAGAGNAETSLGLGWNSVAADGGYQWTHSGALEGSNCAWLVRRGDGTTASFVFNSLPQDFPGFFGDLIPHLHEMFAGVTEWPDTDLFG